MTREEALERLTKIDELFGDIEKHYKVIMDIAKYIREDEFLFLPKLIPVMYFAFRWIFEGINFRMCVETIICYFLMVRLVNYLNSFLLDYITYNQKLPIIRKSYRSIESIFAEINELNFVPKKYLVPFGVKKLINYYTHERIEHVEEALELYDRDFSHRKYIKTKTQASKKRIDDIYRGMNGFFSNDEKERESQLIKWPTEPIEMPDIFKKKK